MMKRPFALLATILASLTGCSSVKVEDYANNSPIMDVREYFNGPIQATGIFIDWSGKADSFFHITMNGSWKGDEGRLEEAFVFDSGAKDSRVWSIRMHDDHHFTGTAHDIIGEATGKQFGNAVNLRYIMRVPSGNRSYDLSMDDWMYRIDQHTVINHITMRKFGLKVGQLIVTFHKK